MIYLDNASTTHKKPIEVIKAVNLAITKFSANPGRSGHNLSLETAVEVAKTRENLCKYFNCEKPEHVIFPSGCTESLNLAILGTAKAGGHVIATVFEHNSSLRPLFELEKEGVIELSIVSPKNKEKITRQDIEPHIKENTYLIVSTHVSNVDGAETDIENIGKLCKENNILYLVDAAQSAGHKKIDMQKNNINFLALAGHKGLYGIQGVGALLINGNTLPKPIKFGGTGTQSISVYQPTEAPECFESGTIATPNILSLNAGLKFVKNNEKEIEEKERKLTLYTINQLKKIEDFIIYTSEKNLNGVIAFNHINYDSSEIADFLNTKGICVRSGLECAPLKHKFLGTEKTGIVRISLSFFTKKFEIDCLISALREIK